MYSPTNSGTAGASLNITGGRCGGGEQMASVSWGPLITARGHLGEASTQGRLGRRPGTLCAFPSVLDATLKLLSENGVY